MNLYSCIVSLFVTVSCVRSQRCECSMNSCGYKVDCWLVSVPRTAAFSNCSSVVLMMPGWFFLFFTRRENQCLNTAYPAGCFSVCIKKTFLLLLSFFLKHGQCMTEITYNYQFIYMMNDQNDQRRLLAQFVPSSVLKPQKFKETKRDSKLCLLLSVNQVQGKTFCHIPELTAGDRSVQTAREPDSGEILLNILKNKYLKMIGLLLQMQLKWLKY